METPKPKGGRPRRRPFAAHNARAVKLRADNAARWLTELGLRLDAEPDVELFLSMERRSYWRWWQENRRLIVGTVEVFSRALVDPISPDDGSASDGE